MEKKTETKAKRIENKDFAKTDAGFKAACAAASKYMRFAGLAPEGVNLIQPTRRQASKYRQHKGAAWTHRKYKRVVEA